MAEWPGWYGPDGPGNVTQDLLDFSASERILPVGMVVFESRVPVGAGALKRHSIPSHSHFLPWAAAGYVLPTHRGRGIGAELLHGLVSKAHELGYAHLYCATSTSASLLTRAGWLPLDSVSMQGKPLVIFRRAARPLAPAACRP